LIFGEQGITLRRKETKSLNEVLRVWRRTRMQEGFRKLRDEVVCSSGRSECPRTFAAGAAAVAEL
jgi:hypothetical protein